MPDKIPNSPNDMPWAFDQTNPNWLRNTIATLHNFSVVDIHWENDHHVSNETGEPAGNWDVIIETAHGKSFTARHEDLRNALWYVTELAEKSDSDDYRKRDDERKAALAKLTPEERRILRV